ncbi:MAG TPA: decaprenyl-phosphate phosphoribosyltransferase [Ginsengibacter sp.]|nr:decaprenyl-phosphate phosphoribosyltransferase [Chitinophagaceae bacterium]HRN73072.1 decaprenyl-phosphate phosphoribosyltransferase [Ginsengibacter sp.]HRP44544.1 decaprenyl-phosphate phosphoribosyltransferase [Ginsengibacter sp.]
MKPYIKLLRPKDWIKNTFLFLPLFFSGELFRVESFIMVLEGFFCFSFVASSIYILNDYRDIEDDKKHPEKKFRPLPAGTVEKSVALVMSVLLLVAGTAWGGFINYHFLVILLLYWLLNIGYSLGLKNISILDIFIIAIGFVLRVNAGSVIIQVPLSEWLIIMVFLLAIFLGLGKRRDDVLLKIKSGAEMRQSIKGYNLEFINISSALVSAVLIVAYFMYTMSPEVIERLGTRRLYFTCIFVLAGVFRYLQLIYIKEKSDSPVKILYRDRFIQVSILLWIITFYVILYMKDVTLFN